MATSSKTASSVNNYREIVYKIVRKIPKGKVSTYGQISKKLRIKNYELIINPRMVGWALHKNRDLKTPCHRVVDRNGRLAPNFAGPQSPGAQATGRRAFSGWEEQKRRLLAEGVKFLDEKHVVLSKYCYFFD